jgi:hypothetical protein
MEKQTAKTQEKTEEEKKRIRELSELRFKIQFHEHSVSFHESFLEHYRKMEGELISSQLNAFDTKQPKTGKENHSRSAEGTAKRNGKSVGSVG